MKSHCSHIRKCLWIYLAGVSATSVVAFVLIYCEMNSFFQACDSAAGSGADFHQHAAALRQRFLLILTACTAMIISGGLVWLRLASRQLNRPLVVMKEAIFRLSHGKLNETIAFDSADEFAEIGSHFNELAANLQELLLYVWKHTGGCLEQLKAMTDQITADGGSRWSAEERRRLENIVSALQDLRAMAKSYVFYDVRLENGKAMAGQEPGCFPTVKTAASK